MRLEVIYSTEALEDFSAILSYYTTFISYTIAENIETGILSHISLISENPGIGHNDRFTKRADYFVFVSVNYKIVYLVESDKVYIIRIFDSRQDPSKLNP